MDHVNIISKEAIKATSPEFQNVIGIFGFLMIGFLIGCLIYNTKLKAVEQERTLIGVVLWVGCSGLALLLILSLIGSIFFKVPTGRYKYKATIDKEQMTVAEYEEFMEAYNHSQCKNGIYYFEDWID